MYTTIEKSGGRRLQRERGPGETPQGDSLRRLAVLPRKASARSGFMAFKRFSSENIYLNRATDRFL